jgi:hypothetical protein
MNVSSEHEPPEAVQARYFRALETQARELARLLLPQDDLDPEYWSAPGVVSGAVIWELSINTAAEEPLRPEEIPLLMGMLGRLRESARDVAEKNEERRKAGRPRGYRMAALLADLRPLWEAAANPAAFVETCLAAVGESRGVEAVRKAIERFGQNQ